ncbi:MAG: hypothetical protein ISR58_17985 [Anaerolineales bacterium]|nr:hypothetical protein [Chloroflexota bacterium]MBL6983068.1 hypothetical protein [Anaerolineales bacterium]
MFSTVEVRWFYQGVIPSDIQTWFDQKVVEGIEPINQPSRTDQYLLQGHNASLGVKLREGRVEIKQRVQEYGYAEFGPAVTGIVKGRKK